jgi:CheY-specific phosphatase CheX
MKMNEAWSSALDQSVRGVFENLCFMVPAPASAEPPEPAAVSRVVLAVDFRGAGRGTLLLALPESMLALVASAMLGEDGPLELAEQHDAACELANIVCGNVLPLVAGERAVFDLSPPRSSTTTDPSLGRGGEASAAVPLDEGLVLASLSLELEEHQGAA